MVNASFRGRPQPIFLSIGEKQRGAVSPPPLLAVTLSLANSYQRLWFTRGGGGGGGMIVCVLLVLAPPRGVGAAMLAMILPIAGRGGPGGRRQLALLWWLL